MKTLFLIPIDRADELPIARYNVQAAHARTGACLILDLRRAEDIDTLLDALVTELRATAEGNGQTFALLGGAESQAAAGLPRFTRIEDLLDELSPARTLPYALELVLPSRLEDLPAVRGFLADAVRRLHPQARDFELAILVDEICQNAIQNSPSNKSHYEVVCRMETDRVRLEVTNQAAESFPPERIMHRRLNSFDDSGEYLGDRGRGLFLIARLADEMDIRSGPDERITVAVTKRLRSAEDPSVAPPVAPPAAPPMAPDPDGAA